MTAHAVVTSLRAFGRLAAAGALAWLAATTAHAKVEIEQQDTQTLYHFTIEGLDFVDRSVDNQTFAVAYLKGVDGYSAVHYEEGKPRVPVLRFYVDGDGEVTFPPPASELKPQLLHSAHPALPSLRPVPKVPGAVAHLVIDREAYLADAPFPAGDHQIDVVGTVRGQQRRLVTVHPVHYDAATGAWTVTPVVTVAVKGTHAAALPAKAGETLAVVVGDALAQSPSLAQYLGGKKKMGYAVDTFVVKKGTTQPADIRAHLQDLLKKTDAPLRWVLLVGGNDDVPGMPSTTISGVTDHYYRALDGDYDKDVGSPDVSVGRLAVTTEADLAVVLAKNARYASGDFAGGDWLHKASWIASDDGGHWQIAEGSFNYVIDKYTRPQAWLGDFPNNPQVGGDQLYAITDKADTPNVLAALNEGRGFVNYGGHGSNDSWAGPSLSMDDLTKLTNADALPVVVANACVTGAFTGDSFAAAWQRNPHGSVLYWGSMDSTYWDEDDIVQRALYDAIFGDHVLSFAGFTEAALAGEWRYYGGADMSKYYWETYVTFGDPTMRMRDRAPVQAQVATARAAADQPVTVTVKDAAGQVVAGARVAVDVGSGPALVAYADQQGQASFAVKPEVKAVHVAVEGDGIKPVVADQSL